MPNAGSSRKPPKYCLHKPSGRAFITLGGRRRYIGKHGTDESWERYHQLILEWRTSNTRTNATEQCLAINELVDEFWRHAEVHYRGPDGAPTSELSCIQLAMKPLRKLYGNALAADFSPKKLIAVRQSMIDKGWTRSSINRHIGRIRHVFRWGVEQELVTQSVWHALMAVRGLQRSRSEARESEPVRSVPIAFINAIEPYVSRQIWALIQLQLLTAARAGELVIMRPIDIDTSISPWLYRPARHKNEHRGHDRTIYLGPRAQTIVEPYLRRDTHAIVFSPAEAESERRANVHRNRNTPLHQGNRPGSNRKRRPKRAAGDRYSVASYRRAIQRAIDAANSVEKARAEQDNRAPQPVARWSPHQLRHTAATALRREHGLDAARVILGHRSATTTEIYAEPDKLKAEQIIARIG